jgi:hypothetical protein
MKAILAALVSAGLLAAFAGTASAGSDNDSDHKYRRHHARQYYKAPSGVTERQLRNLRAYERGEYYERDSNALPVGSRAWWEQKERESGGDNRP